MNWLAAGRATKTTRPPVSRSGSGTARQAHFPRERFGQVFGKLRRVQGHGRVVLESEASGVEAGGFLGLADPHDRRRAQLGHTVGQRRRRVPGSGIDELHQPAQAAHDRIGGPGLLM